jgi:NADH dehydrogenase
LREHGLEIVLGDLKDPSSLDAACRGIDTVLTTANAILPRLPGDSLRSVDRDGSLALLLAARSAGVRRFIYTSVSPTMPANNPFIRFKREVEHRVRSSGVPWTILQPSAFMEIHAGPAAGWDFVHGRARVMGSGRAPICYISLDDVAAVAINCLTDPGTVDRDLHLTGPDPLSALDAVQVAEEITGRRFKVQRMPTAVLRVASPLVRPFNPGLSAILAMGVGMEQGERTDLGHRLPQLGVIPKTFTEYVTEQSRQARAHE